MLLWPTVWKSLPKSRMFAVNCLAGLGYQEWGSSPGAVDSRDGRGGCSATRGTASREAATPYRIRKVQLSPEARAVVAVRGIVDRGRELADGRDAAHEGRGRAPGRVLPVARIPGTVRSFAAHLAGEARWRLRRPTLFLISLAEMTGSSLRVDLSRAIRASAPSEGRRRFRSRSRRGVGGP
jgi:hypothetical protein